MTRLALLEAAQPGDMAHSSGSDGVACLEFKLNISFLQFIFIILGLFFLKPELGVFSIFDCALRGLIRAVFNEPSSICVFPTPKEAIGNKKMPI